MGGSLRLLSLALTLTLVPLAGCLGDADGPAGGLLTDDALARRPVVLGWGLTDCRFAVAFVPVASAAFDPFMPAGFRAATPEESGLPPDPRGDALLGLEAWSCASGVGHNDTTIEGLAYGSVFTPVIPPAAYRNESVALYFVKWDVLVPDAARRAVLQAAGVPAVDGAVASTTGGNTGVELPTQNAFSWGLTLGDYGYGLHGAAAADQPALHEFTFMEFTPTANGLAVWKTDVVAPTVDAGTGYVKFPLGHWPTGVAGAERANAYYIAGVGSFVNGSVTLPAAALDE